MGVTTQFAKFLIEAKEHGASYESTLTLGRQNLFADSKELSRLLKEHSLWPERMTPDRFDEAVGKSTYSEPLIEMLGARRTDAMDASDFEGATIIHDLNREIPAELRERFDCVIDGGLLEHVFNFPTAIRNCMEMVKRGGHIVLGTPANNFLGHGFYQFSPELFYRVFSKENGFEVVRMVLQEHDLCHSLFRGIPVRHEHAGPRYAVSDPAKIGCRVELVNNEPALLFILAKRNEIVPIFNSPVQQSDYQVLWEQNGPSPIESPTYVEPLWKRSLAALIKAIVPRRYHSPLKNRIFSSLEKTIGARRYEEWKRLKSLENTQLFKRID